MPEGITKAGSTPVRTIDKELAALNGSRCPIPKLFTDLFIPDFCRSLIALRFLKQRPLRWAFSDAGFCASRVRKTAVSAPCLGVLIRGRNKASVRGSNHRFIAISLVLTIPGSVANTRMPCPESRSANSRLYTKMALLERA